MAARVSIQGFDTPVNGYRANNLHGICGKEDQEAKERCALSQKTFFGPDKPYIHGRSAAYG